MRRKKDKAEPEPPWLFGIIDPKERARRRPPWLERDPKDGLTLRQAMLYYAEDPAAAKLVFELELCGYGGDPPMEYGLDGWPTPREELADFRINSRRLQDERPRLERSLVDKLLAGKLVATGFSSQSPLDIPAQSISPDRWRVLKPNIKASEASAPGVVVSGILVFKPRRRDPAGSRETAKFAPAEMQRWYRDRVSKLVAAGRIPSRDEDWQAAKERFGTAIPRDTVRELRRKLAPAEWRRFGRRKRDS